ncbi:MAG TPA: hypothetical protein VFV70_00845 [Hyphomonadaceae bacterium]|nr:hypothetical protein [Hyphomonadaceae bacterium]
MTDQVRAAREDLAFMRELAEDRGPLPSHLGQHIFWPGLLYGLNVIATWAGLAGVIPWPNDWYVWAWAPATAAYVPICLWINLRSSKQPWGPGARMFAAAWSAVALLTLTVVTVVITASFRTGLNYAGVWPAFALGIYGASWLVMGILLKRMWAVAVAFGCSVTAIVMSFLIDSPHMWLVMGIGLLLLLAVPGAAIMRKNKTA